MSAGGCSEVSSVKMKIDEFIKIVNVVTVAVSAVVIGIAAWVVLKK